MNILDIIPFKFFTLVDKIITVSKNKNFICSLKNISNNEIYLNNHFIGNSIVPGSIIIESIAQTSMILIYFKYNLKIEQKNYYLASIDKIKFGFPIYPGDQIINKSYYINKKKNFVKFKIISFIKKKIILSSNMIFKLNI